MKKFVLAFSVSGTFFCTIATGNLYGQIAPTTNKPVAPNHAGEKVKTKITQAETSGSQSNSNSQKSLLHVSNVDTTFLVLSDKQVNRILENFQHHGDILSPGEIALLGALIGALSAITAQLLFFLLSTKNEKKKVRLELLTEERRLSVMLVEYYRELAWLKVTMQFWLHSYAISNDLDDFKESLFFRDKIPECKRRINEATAEYFKTVTKFMFLINKENNLFEKLSGIRVFPPLNSESSNFATTNNLTALQTASENEVITLRAEYFKLNEKLDNIYMEMKDLNG